MTTKLDGDRTIDAPAARRDSTRIATGTAAKAAKAYGCRTKLGAHPLPWVDLPEKQDEYVPLSGATGTCAGIPEGPGITTDRETARDAAPIERCLLGGDARTDTPWKPEAHFGAYAVQERAAYERWPGYGSHIPSHAPQGAFIDDAGYWASAACPTGGGERALFTVRRTAPRTASYPTRAQLAYVKQALRIFAIRVAQAHGCAAPKVP
ncbi:hypothetical protein MTQ10_24735 [Streptomyces sp. XM83C]|uniref:hypothetical protein n=1 Tax=Streptomyces sp. XM83C TaxID=2929781 RepID=UPI001FF899AF|nr:hypothetical protein [Streptomyces sp. XM83C]MCK1822719.1 hypothetical protein [Streptomyces sp. XM83C]